MEADIQETPFFLNCFYYYYTKEVPESIITTVQPLFIVMRK